MKKHKERAHSKFSASGAERWVNCPGSVALSEGLPDKTSFWAEEGTRAHEMLERYMRYAIEKKLPEIKTNTMDLMTHYVVEAANFMLKIHAENPGSIIQVESRVYLDFIHPEMFGTYDGAVIDYFDTLHVFDFKYGRGHVVDPKNNLQMLFYGVGVAHLHHWNFKKARLWIIQPRIRGYRGPVFWDVAIEDLKLYADFFQEAVETVECEPETFSQGPWCHWCKAKSICPLTTGKKHQKALEIFS